jgi:hypothetical protein|tara:strand:+ start:703 stop:903 length:201 start_codon:yes stop_codon:yes gene_type:complete
MKDSGMSDSAFYKFQEKIQKKMKKFSADLDTEIDKEALKARFKRNTKPVERKKTLWERIKGYFYVN